MFAGRADDQVKIRGYRVEPGEIEAAVDFAAGRREGCRRGAEGRRAAPRLVAYVVPAASEFEPSELTAALRDALARTSPTTCCPPRG